MAAKSAHPIVVLTKPRQFAAVRELAEDIICVDALESLAPIADGCLISFQTGIIVPDILLSGFRHAINVHGGPPSFPGRDPHHWAAYHDSDTFGATAHFMARAVDTGPIILTVIERMNASRVPAAYRDVGERCSFAALKRIFTALNAGTLAASGQSWERRPYRRTDLLAMCDLRGLDAQERIRRQRAFDGFQRHFLLD